MLWESTRGSGMQGQNNPAHSNAKQSGGECAYGVAQRRSATDRQGARCRSALRRPQSQDVVCNGG